jgi:hypothetical protein
MKFLNKYTFMLTAILLAVIAFAFVKYIGTEMYGLTEMQANLVAGGAGAFVIAAPILSSYIPELFPAGALFCALVAKNIGRNPNPKNIAGMQLDHYYAFYEDIDTFPTGLTPDFLAAATFGALVTIAEEDVFVMKAGKFFHKLPCTPEEGQVKSTLVGPVDSMAFENTASFGNANNNDPLRGFLGFTANKPVIIVMCELNSSLKVVGTQGYPARLATGDAQNGGKVTDGNIVKHSYKSYSEVPCPTILSPIPLDPAEV